MNIKEILNLEVEYPSIETINSYLKNSISLADYCSAVTYLLQIYNHFEQYQESLLYAERIIKISEEQNKITLSETFHQLFLAAMGIKSDVTIKNILSSAIKVRKPNEKQVLVDEIQFLMEYKLDYKVQFESLYGLKLSFEQNNYISLAGIQLYLDRNEPEKALNIIRQLTITDYEYSTELIKVVLNFYHTVSNYDEIINFSQTLMEQNIITADILSELITAYIQKGENTKIENLDSMYINRIDDMPPKERIKVYKSLLEFYNLINNNFSINFFTKKIEETNKKIEVEKNIQAKKDEVVKINKQQDIIVTAFINEQDKKERNDEIKNFNPKTLMDIITQFSQIDIFASLKEKINTLFLLGKQYYDFYEAVLYCENKSPNTYWFKFDGTYDKQISSNLVTDSIYEYLLNSNESIDSLCDNLNWKINMVDQRPYSPTYVKLFGIKLSDDVAITFHFKKLPKVDINEIMLYSAKFIELIETELLFEEILDDSRKMDNIFNKSLLPIRRYENKKFIWNKPSQRQFNVQVNTDLDIFLKGMEKDKQLIYQSSFGKLTKEQGFNQFYYWYENTYIKEQMISFKLNNQFVVFSFFSPITEVKSESEQYRDESLTNSITKLDNERSFIKNFSTLAQNKFTLFYISLDIDLVELLDYNKINTYFTEFTRLIQTNYFSNKIYHIDKTKLILVLNFNDIRIVEKEIASLTQLISNSESNSLKDFYYSAKIVTLRYPVTTNESKPEKILNYLNIGLKYLNDNKQGYLDFNYKIYEEYNYESNFLLRVNHALNSYEVDLKFSQIIDKRTNLVDSYLIEPYIPKLEISKNQMRLLAKKKNNLKEFELKYLDVIFEFIISLLQKAQRLIKLIIEVSFQSLDSDAFYNKLKNRLQDLNISPTLLGIIVYDIPREKNINNTIGRYSDRGIEVIANSLASFMNSDFQAVAINYVTSSFINDTNLDFLNQLLTKFEKKLYLMQINSQEVSDLVTQKGIYLISGSIYKNLKSSELIEKIISLL